MKRTSMTLRKLFLLITFVVSAVATAQTDSAACEPCHDAMSQPHAIDSLSVVASSVASDTTSAYADTLLSQATADILPTPASALAALSKDDPSHRFHPAEWIVPGGVAVFSAICVNSSWGKQWRSWVQQRASQRGYHKLWADDYLQYSPMVVVYGLDLLGVKAQHRFVDRTILLAMSAFTMALVVNVAKYTFKEMRPDSSTRNSFPSGHTATSFMGAEFLWQEYRSTQPWLGYTGYAIALGVGYMRVHNHRHWVNDVLGGAAIGMLSTKFAYWLYPKIFKNRAERHGCVKPRKSLTAFGLPYFGNGSAGVNVALAF